MCDNIFHTNTGPLRQGRRVVLPTNNILICNIEIKLVKVGYYFIIVTSTYDKTGVKKTIKTFFFF